MGNARARVREAAARGRKQHRLSRNRSPPDGARDGISSTLIAFGEKVASEAPTHAFRGDLSATKLHTLTYDHRRAIPRLRGLAFGRRSAAPHRRTALGRPPLLSCHKSLLLLLESLLRLPLLLALLLEKGPQGVDLFG